MLPEVLRPICSELRARDCSGLEVLLGLNEKELGSRLSGDTQFTVPELMSVAQWLGRPASVFFASFDRILGGDDKFTEGLP
jgi:hypothetical protein